MACHDGDDKAGGRRQAEDLREKEEEVPLARNQRACGSRDWRR
jgi:hypothetical protein